MEIVKDIHVLFLGSYGSGKTSVIRQYFKDVTASYNLKEGPTVSDELYFKTKEQHPMGLANSSLKVYDPGHGLDVDSEVGSAVMDAIVVCADVTDESSIKMAFLYNHALIPRKMFQEKAKHSKHSNLILCLTKCDMLTWHFSLDQLIKENEKLIFPFMIVQTSAKEGRGCDLLFDQTIKDGLDKWFD